MDLTQLAALSTDIARLLKTELGPHGTVTAMAGAVIVNISRVDFENKLGAMLQQIYRTVDKNFPVRKGDLSLVIRDTESRYENVFKIWRSGPDKAAKND